MAEGNQQTQQEESQQQPSKKELSKLAYAGYYSVLFLAYWFGSSRFDVDGDGDFDPEDVQAYLQDKGILKKNMRRPSKTAMGNTVSTSSAAGGSQPAAAKAEEGGAKPPAAGGAGFFDRDGDGDVDAEDLIFTKVEGDAQEDIAMQNLKSGQIRPWFILGECAVCLLLWIIMAGVKSAEIGGDYFSVKGGLDTFYDRMTDLRFFGNECEDYRVQIWRWMTYQFTHIGVAHVLSNVLLNLALGIPLEGIHGPLRLATMFNVGVFGGACCAMVSDVHTAVVGCSGGCYALLGIHTADLIMNWSEKKFRLPTLLLLGTLVGIDVLAYAGSAGEDNKSHAAHVGGAIAGLLVGVTTCKNMKVLRRERYFVAAAWITGTCLTIFCLAWLFGQPEPLTIWEAMAGEDAWCWHGQMLDLDLTPRAFRCIRCGTLECVEEWQAFNANRTPAIKALWASVGKAAEAPTAVMSAGLENCEAQGWYSR